MRFSEFTFIKNTFTCLKLYKCSCTNLNRMIFFFYFITINYFVDESHESTNADRSNPGMHNVKQYFLWVYTTVCSYNPTYILFEQYMKTSNIR